MFKQPNRNNVLKPKVQYQESLSSSSTSAPSWAIQYETCLMRMRFPRTKTKDVSDKSAQYKSMSLQTYMMHENAICSDIWDQVKNIMLSLEAPE